MSCTPLAVLAFLALVLVGCAEEPEPRFEEPGSGSPTSVLPSSEPTESTSSPPPVVEVLTPEETVRAWVEARNTLLGSGDASELDDLTSPDCVTCRALNEEVIATYDAGGSITSTGWVIRGAKPKPDFETSRTVASLIAFSSGVRVPVPGADPIRYPAQENFLNFTMRRMAGRWLVARVVFLG